MGSVLMRQVIAAIAVLVTLGGCNTAHAGCRLRVVNYNVGIEDFLELLGQWGPCT